MSGVGAAYRSKAAQAVLGPYRSSLIPATLWTGWLDATGALIAMTGMSVAHGAFGPVANGVANTAVIDSGVAGTGWTIHAVGLFDAATGGALVISADLPAPLSPTSGDPLAIDAGSLVFTVPA